MESCSNGERLVGGLICFPESPAGFMSTFYGVALSILGVISLLYLIYGAYIVMLSQGNPQEVKRGKSYIFYAVFGLAVGILGFVIVEVIFVDLLKIPGFE